MTDASTMRMDLLETGVGEVRDVSMLAVSKAIDQKARFEALIASFKGSSADTPLKECFRTVMKYCAKPLIVVVMAYIWLVRKLYALYKVLPYNVLQMIFGLGLCFFGGVYFTAIAAVEALKNFGGAQLLVELQVLYKDGCQIAEASAVDDAIDADHDGVADVLQMSHSELLSHKASVAMAAVTDPEGLMKTLEFFLTAYLSVIATLKFQYAATVALCLGVADMVKVPLCMFFAPFLALAMGPKLHHWVPTIIMTTAKVIAIVAACYVQSVISAFYSGIRGGKLFAIGLMNFMGENKLIVPFDAEKTYADEALAYPLALAGFLYQWHIGFSLGFPLNLILFPCTIVEWILRLQVFG